MASERRDARPIRILVVDHDPIDVGNLVATLPFAVETLVASLYLRRAAARQPG